MDSGCKSYLEDSATCCAKSPVRLAACWRCRKRKRRHQRSERHHHRNLRISGQDQEIATVGGRKSKHNCGIMFLFTAYETTTGDSTTGLRKAGIRALLDTLKLVLDVKDKMLVATLATTASTWHRPGKETQGGQGA